MTNKEKFLSLPAEDGSATVKYMKQSYRNRDMLKESFLIAIKVLMKLDELGWTQKDLAEAMAVTPQQVNKIVRGKQNLTLDTIIKLQTILDIPLLASCSESGGDKEKEKEEAKEIVIENKVSPAMPVRPRSQPGAAARPQL